ncbi:AfsR/SARP family transcriptional regulator [Kitasatospora azatica]|uniref:AfsR/SARP family transcriptional regulator n=1 Tax=Kitasatospora azatica TaxID=58347 RepID=UPI0007C6542D|nr:AfsR/SARP family transcriptional regulator [Kitasatospora azatica]
MVEISARVLGELSVRAGGRDAAPSAPKPRQVLALLAINANRLIHTSDFYRELWGDRPPRTAAATLQTYVGQLRRSLSEALGVTPQAASETMLITQPGGYVLRVAAEHLDLEQYRQVLARAEESRRSQKMEEAVFCYRSAIDLWRGPALADINCGPILRAWADRFNEGRLNATEQLIALELQLGRPLNVLSDLRELTAHHPFHENVHGQLMIALFQAGRRSEALEIYRTLRQRIVDELGMEPSAYLTLLQQEIIRSGPQRRGPIAYRDMKFSA